MSIVYGEYNPFLNVRYSYANGFAISNDATTPNTLLDIGVGSIRDSSDTFQIINSAPVVINSANKGLNGLDTGTIAASKVYYVYVIGDAVTGLTTGAMISLASPLVGPLMPYGYNVQALIGYVATDSSENFLKGYWTVTNTGDRLFMYDAPQATAVTAGGSTSYANVDLTKFVPLVNNLPVWAYTVYTPNAASDTLKLQPGNATGDAITITAQVAHVIVTSNSLLLAQNVVISTVNSPTINYKVSSGSDAVAVDVAGYQYFI